MVLSVFIIEAEVGDWEVKCSETDWMERKN